MAVTGVPALSVAVNETVNVVAVVGVPVIAPAVFILNPVGKVPLVTAKVTGAVPPMEITDDE